MSTTTLVHKLTTVCLIAVFAVVLQSCGGSSNKKADVPDPEVTRLTGELETAEAEVTRLGGEVTRLEGEVTRLEGELETAKNDADADGKNDEVARLEGELATANAELTRIRTEAADVAAAAKAKTDSELAGGLDTLLGTQQFAEASLPDPAITSIDAKSTPAGVNVTINGTPGMPVTSPYAVVSSPTTPDIAGWHEEVQGLKEPAATSRATLVAVYTDVGRTNMKSLLKVEMAEDMNSFFAVTDGADFIKNADTPNLPSAPASGALTVFLGAPVTPVGSTTPTIQFEGTWRGVPGTFVCSACSTTQRLMVTAELVMGEEELTANLDSQDWSFQPTNRMATIQDNADYLYFGWWHDVPKASTGAHEFRTFAGGNQAFDLSNVQALEGEATYMGPATGKYTQEGGSRLSPTYSADAFTATATLTADFDEDNTLGTIKGSIGSFHSGDGSALAGWQVKLNPLELSGSDAIVSTDVADIADATMGNAVAKIGSTESDNGSWSAAFFGNNRQDGEPGSVAGQFDANFVDANIHIVGAYGAHKTGN